MSKTWFVIKARNHYHNLHAWREAQCAVAYTAYRPAEGAADRTSDFLGHDGPCRCDRDDDPSPVDSPALPRPATPHEQDSSAPEKHTPLP